MQNLFTKSLKSKLILLFLIASIIPVTTVGFMSYLSGKSTIRDRLYESFTTIAKSREAAVVLYLKSKIERARDFASDGTILDNIRVYNYLKTNSIMEKDNVIKYLNRHLSKSKMTLDKSILGINLVDTNDFIIASTDESEIGLKVPFKDYSVSRYKPAYDNVCVSDIFLSANFKKNIPIFLTLAPLTDLKSGEPLGILVVYYRTDVINEIVSNSEGMGETGEVYIVNKDGYMITESKLKKDLILKQQVNSEPVRLFHENGVTMNGIYPDYRGVLIAGSSVGEVIKQEFGLGWTILAEIDVAEAFLPVNILKRRIVFILMLVLIAVSILAYLISMTILKPILLLTTATKFAGKIDLSKRLEIFSKDEIGTLADSFNKMIDDLRSSRNELTRSKDYTESIINSMADALIVVDYNATIKAVNKAALNLLGYEEKMLEGKPVKLIFGKDEIFEKPGFEKYVSKGFARGLEKFCIKKNGSNIPVSFSASVIRGDSEPFQGIVCVMRDITKRKIIEGQLAERSRIASLGSDIGVALTQNDSLQGNLQSCTIAIVKHLDAAFARIWTINESKSFLILQASAGLYTHIDGKHSRIKFGQFKIGKIAKEKRPHLTNNVSGDFEIVDQEWAKRMNMVAFAGYPLIVEDKLVGVMAIFSYEKLSESVLQAMASVSNEIALGIERKQVEEELIKSHHLLEERVKVRTQEIEKAYKKLKETQNQLIQSEKMASIGKLSAGIAHEINNPLASVGGCAEGLLARFKDGNGDSANKVLNHDTEIFQEYLKIICNETFRCKTIISKLLNFSRQVEPVFDKQDINLLIQESLAIIKHQISDKLFVVNLFNKPIIVKGDAHQLKQVFLNLLINASESIEGTGEISIKSSIDKNNATIVFRDNGCGIKLDNFKKIFDPFFTTKLVGKGTGLGLSICYGIITGHGGTIIPASEGEGKGSTFTIILPLETD